MSLTRHLILPAVLFLAAFFGAFVSAEDPKPEGPKADPEGTPIEIRITGKVTTYSLDAASAAAYARDREVLKPGQTPALPAPRIELTLEFRNTSDKTQRILVGGDNAKVILTLEGEGAMNHLLMPAETEQHIESGTLDIAPGKTESIPLVSLRSGFRDRSHYACWTKAGEYSLTARYETGVNPRPEGAYDSGNGYGYVILTSAPICLTVVEAK